MQVDRRYKGLDKIASTDQCRHALMHIAIKRTDAEHGFAEATDGRRLVRVPVEFDKKEEFPPISDGKNDRALMTVEAWKAGFKRMDWQAKNRTSFAVFTFTKDTVSPLGGPTYKLGEGTYPGTDHVVPDVKHWGDVALLSFNPTFAAEINSVFSNERGCTIAVNVADPDGPMVVGSDEADCIGIVMPCREHRTTYFAGRGLPLKRGGYQVVSKPKIEGRKQEYERHNKALSEIVDCFVAETGVNPATATITALMVWIEEQAAKVEPIPEAPVDSKPAEPASAPAKQDRRCGTCKWDHLCSTPVTQKERDAAGNPCTDCSDYPALSRWTPRHAPVTACQSSSPSEEVAQAGEPTPPPVAG